MCSVRRKIGAAATVICGVAAVALSMDGGAARAQYIDPAAKRDYAFKVGAFIPTEQDVRRSSGTEVFSAEFDAVIQRFPESSFNSLLSVGYMERGGFRMIPVTVSQIYRDPGNASAYNYYYGVGLGYYITRLNTPEGDTSGKVKGLFGGFVVAGVDLTRNYFAEAKYHYVSKYDNKFVGGFQLSLGTRF